MIRDFVLIWLGMMLAVTALFYLRDRAMRKKESFDPNQPDHVVSLARLLDTILNEEREDIRFALLIWQDTRDNVQGMISNDTRDKIVVGMLDDAKARIKRASGVIHHTAGHA